ncbi:hypothetical protein ACOME3_001910 [Neoechinorhynchus agilis]
MFSIERLLSDEKKSSEKVSNEPIKSIDRLQENRKPKNKEKKVRNKLNHEQKQILIMLYGINKYPDENCLKGYSTALNLSINVVKIWFQNRRTRERRRLGSSFKRQDFVPTQINANQIMTFSLFPHAYNAVLYPGNYWYFPF